MDKEENKKEELNEVSEEKEVNVEPQEKVEETKEKVERKEEPKKEETKKEEAKEVEVIENKSQDSNTKVESKGLGIAAMVLGIISLVFWCVWYISIPCAILAIVFGAVGRKKAGKGMAITGLVLGIITACLLALTILFGVTLFSSIISSPETWEDMINTSYNYTYEYDYDF